MLALANYKLHTHSYSYLLYVLHHLLHFAYVESNKLQYLRQLENGLLVYVLFSLIF